MKKNHVYYVEYIQTATDTAQGIFVVASSKQEAYDTAVYEVLDHIPYSAWVASVIYKNGNSKQFNTFSGKPF